MTSLEGSRAGTTFPTVFVGALSLHSTEHSLQSYFSRFGTIIRAKLILDLHTGKSKRCALIFCLDRKTADSILSHCRHEVDGKTVRVETAEREKISTKALESRILFVGNIHMQTQDSQLATFFSPFGPVISVKSFLLNKDARTRNAKITFRNEQAVEAALNRPGPLVLQGHTLLVSPYTPHRKKSGSAPSVRRPELPQSFDSPDWPYSSEEDSLGNTPWDGPSDATSNYNYLERSQPALNFTESAFGAYCSNFADFSLREEDRRFFSSEAIPDDPGLPADSYSLPPPSPCLYVTGLELQGDRLFNIFCKNR